MNDKQSDLEQRVADLTAEIARLRRSVFIGFGVMAILLVVGFLDRDLVLIAATIGIVLWAVMHIGTSFATALSRRHVSQSGRHVA
jgi:hypothetical protein